MKKEVKLRKLSLVAFVFLFCFFLERERERQDLLRKQFQQQPRDRSFVSGMLIVAFIFSSS